MDYNDIEQEEEMHTGDEQNLDDDALVDELMDLIASRPLVKRKGPLVVKPPVKKGKISKQKVKVRRVRPRDRIRAQRRNRPSALLRQPTTRDISPPVRNVSPFPPTPPPSSPIPLVDRYDEVDLPDFPEPRPVKESSAKERIQQARREQGLARGTRHNLPWQNVTSIPHGRLALVKTPSGKNTRQEGGGLFKMKKTKKSLILRPKLWKTR